MIYNSSRVPMIWVFMGFFCSLVGFWPRTNAEYFSSIDSLIDLSYVEFGLMESFREFFVERDKEFATYRIFIAQVKAQHEEALKNTDDFLGNPINAYTLIKRMVVDWNQMREAINNSPARQLLSKLVDEVSKESPIPSHDEFVGAIKGLARLQRVYKLNPADLVKGKINNIEYGTDLNWHDCFEIAATLYDNKEYEFAIEWFNITLQLLEHFNADDAFSLQLITDDIPGTKRKFTIDSYEFLALAHFELGQREKAINYSEAILKISPKHNVKEMRLYMQTATLPTAKYADPKIGYDWYKNYTALCRGEQIPQKIHHRMKCRITTQKNPLFVLAPLKIERLSYDPDVVLYHGLLQDDQIEKIIAEADGRMFRSKVGTSSKQSEGRVSQQAWVGYTSEIMIWVQRLVGEITGFDMTSSELMQVANYGIGGQYEPHHDFSMLNRDMKKWGHRISTQMFYLSDVEQGGYTVFPKLNLFLRPVKGGMVRWYNLHKSLTGDFRTLHAGCPVLMGSKRIGNIWIHEEYQELRRPCGLQSDSYKSIGYK